MVTVQTGVVLIAVSMELRGKIPGVLRVLPVVISQIRLSANSHVRLCEIATSELSIVAWRIKTYVMLT